MSKSRLKFIVILALCMAACLFAGCSIGFETYEEVLEKYDIASQVTYYSNGGCFNQNTAILSMEIEFTSGSKFYNVEVGSGVDDVSRSNYNLVGWYYVDQRTVTEENEDGETEDVLYFVLDVTDEYVTSNFAHTVNGQTVYYYEYTSEVSTGDDEEDEEEVDEEAEIDYSDLTTYMYFVKASDGEWLMSQEDYDYYVRIRKQNSDDGSINVPDLKLGDAVDTTMTLADDTHYYVVADWVKAVSINYVLAMKSGETATSITVGDSTVNVGEVIYQEYFGTASAITRSDSSGFPSSVVFKDATLLAFYYDAACTQPVNGAAIQKPEEDSEGNIEDVTIYAQCITGLYTVVREASDVVSMFNSGGSNDFYIYNDIDCSAVTASPMSAFRGEIRGNGYTISNLAVSKSSLSANSITALFGIIYSGAKISDLTINKVTIEYSTRAVQFVYVYLVGVIGSGVTAADIDLSGLTLKDVTLNITLATYSTGYTTIGNIQKISGAYQQDNWLYGTMAGYSSDSDTDSEITTTYKCVNLNGASLTVHEGTSDTDGTLVVQI